MNASGSAAALAGIRVEATRAGLLEPRRGRHAARAAVCGSLLAAALGVAWGHEGRGLALLAAGASGFLCVQLGFLAHDAGHRSVARSEWGNAVVGHLFFTVLNGLGFQSWRTSHGAHHAGCQDESRDPDMWVDHGVSLTPASAEAKRGLDRLLLPYQAAYLWPLSLLFAHNLRLQSLGRSLGQPQRHRADALLLPVHYVLWFGAPLAAGAGLGRSLWVYAVASAVMGAYLAVLFWVNHVGMPALGLGHGLTPFEQQVVGSRNIRNPAAVDAFFGGLNFQIEHHLLPDCPGPNLRELQTITRRVCEDAGLPYQEERFGEAIASVTRHVRAMASSARSATSGGPLSRGSRATL